MRTLVINSHFNVPEENCNYTVDRARWPLRASLRDTLCKHPPSPETRLPPPDRARSLPTLRKAVACSCNKLMRQLRPCGRGCGGVRDSRASPAWGGGRGRRSWQRRRPPPSAESLGVRVLRDVGDRVLARVDLLGVGIRDLNNKLILKRHDDLNRVEAVEA